MRIIVDVMGGDNAPDAIALGAIEAAKEEKLDVVLVGRGEAILQCLKNYGMETLPAGVEIANADDVVDMHDDPASVMKTRKNSSMLVGLQMLKDGGGDAFVSDLLTRRIDTLNKRMLDLVNETVAAGKDVESSEDEFKGISDQIEQLNRRIAAIQESIHKDGSRQARLEEIQNIIAERNANETQYDDSIVRQMIECIKVHNDGKLTIIFGGGYEIEETL